MTRHARPARRPAVRAPVAVLAGVVLALSAAACGSTTSHRGSKQTTSARGSGALAFARCMRSHRVSRFPDPESANPAKYPDAQQLGVSAPQYEAALKACQSLLPTGSENRFSRAQVRVLLVGMLRFSRCMRAHGVPHWPDPTVDSQGRASFNLIGVSGVDSPQAARARTACHQLLPSALGGIPVRQA